MNRTLRRPLTLRRAQAGVTLVESTVATALVAVIGTLAVPGFEDAIQRRHLEGAASQLETDLHYVRAAAVARHAPLRVSFESAAAGSCYVIHTGGAGACQCNGGDTPVCAPGAQAERSVRFAAGDRIGLKANVGSVLFDPVKGTSTPAATVQFTSRNGAQVRQVVNIMGRVRSCSPNAALPGIKRC
jgi:type IV fimbrial biogenesis protein FimT